MDEVLVLAPAPRPVPWSLRAQVMGSGVMPLLGWIFLGVGLVVASFFLAMAEPLFGDPFAGPLVTVEGRVLRLEPTNVRVNDRDVVAVHFEYQLGDRPHRGVSYTSTAAPAPESVVPVEVVRGQPRHARIRGLRTAMFPSFAAFVLIFPAIGAAFVLVGLWLGARKVRLLRHGKLARGRVVDAQPTNTKINNQRVHRVTFAFVDGAGRERTAVLRTHRLHAISDQADELLLYDPAGPGIVAWDLLPSRPEVDRDGHFEAVGLGRLVPVLLPPTLVAVATSVASAILDKGAG